MDEAFRSLTARADFVQAFISTQVAATLSRCEGASVRIQRRLDALHAKEPK
jgi:hypothetical protein